VEITFEMFDNLQNEQQKLADEITRLQARVSALEGGARLPVDQKIEFQPTSCEAHIMQNAPAPVSAPVKPQPETVLTPDISVGWVGGRRG
jgi:hypothetical protein